MAEDENKTGNVQNDITDIEKGDNSSISYSEGNLHDASENLRKEAKKIGEEDKTSPDNVPDDKPKLETIRGDRVRENPGKVEKIRTSAGIFSRKPIVVVLIIGVIILGGVLLYTQFQLSNQSYKIENFNALWNQSLGDLRSGNTTIEEYCNNRVHDENLCIQFRKLQYMN